MIDYKINWVIKNQIAISSAPQHESDFLALKEIGIRNILCLCDANEMPDPPDEYSYFDLKRMVLPDHKSTRNIEKSEIEEILNTMDNLLKDGPLLVNCFAGIERSPIVIIAWLIREKRIKFLNAYDYLKSVHPDSNPLISHINVIKQLEN